MAIDHFLTKFGIFWLSKIHFVRTKFHLLYIFNEKPLKLAIFKSIRPFLNIISGTVTILHIRVFGCTLSMHCECWFFVASQSKPRWLCLVIPYIAFCSQWKSFAVFADYFMTTKVFWWNFCVHVFQNGVIQVLQALWEGQL